MSRFKYNLVAHYDEIGLKGKNQGFFIKKLLDNIKQALGDTAVVKRREGKIVIDGDFDFEKAIERLKLIPGISNVALAIEVESEVMKIGEAAVELLNKYKPATFKIESTRSYKPFPLNSMELSREVGSLALDGYQGELKVDVHRPELMIKVELSKEKTYVLGRKELGVGGLPVGATGKVVCLLSGGIDSPVAAFQMMKRGAKVIFVHFHNQTINKKGVESKIKKLADKLNEIQGDSKLYIVPFSDLQKEVIGKIPSAIRMIVYRRLMYKIAEKIAVKEGAQALITGDSLAQVASQTLENMSVIYEATDLLKLSPLVGLNKVEIMKIAERIGTYDISIEPYEDCCSLLIAKHPETRAKLADILKAEGELDVEALVHSAVDSINR